MYVDKKIWIAQSDKNIYLLPEMANRHGLIAGASGTGKTITLKVLAESFSDAGVPVFLADVKGDVSGLAKPGKDSEKMQKRIKRFGIENFEYRGFPTEFWDIYGENGHPVRATISDMGPMMLSRLFNLTDVQADVLNIVFRIADDKGLLLIDIKDLISMLQYVNENKEEFIAEYGNMTTQSIGAVQRSVRALEDQGGDIFFGEPALELEDWMRTNEEGKGYINILHSVKLAHNPILYATFMIWMMSELFEKLPEAGDLDKPKLVFFFDEAHMLFTDAPKSMVQKVEQMVKLIRSKGVGIYFISQSPSDIPDQVLAQLSNRIQHALRAYTPAEQKAVKAAASSFRVNPTIKTDEAIMDLGVGEALISLLDEDGRPTIVERAFILPPQSLMAAITAEDYKDVIEASEFHKKYCEVKDRKSAYESLEKEKAAAAKKKEAESKPAAKTTAKPKAEPKKATATKKTTSKKSSTASKAADKVVGSAATTIGRSIGNSIVRGLFGNRK